MNKVTATNKFLAKRGVVIDEPHKEKKEKNILKWKEILRKKLNNENTSPIGVTKKSHVKTPVQRKTAKFSRGINRIKSRHNKTQAEIKATRGK
jgi:hypothetical protein